MKKIYTCMGCGFKTLENVFSEDEICKICNLQETNYGTLKPYETPFMNDLTMLEYQQKILKEIPCNIKKYKKRKKEYIRNPLWKPINENKLDKNHDYFPRWKFEEFYEKYPKYSDYHRKLMEEAQKYNPDDKVHLDC